MKKKLLACFVALCLMLQLVPIQAIGAGTENDEKYVIQLVMDGLSDTMYDTIKAAGAQTPNIDALIADGSRLRKVETVIPTYGGSQAAALTGASTKTNDFLYRYYNAKDNKIYFNAYDMKAQTLFEKIEASKPELSVLATGWSVVSNSIEGRGVYKEGDPKHVFKDYGTGDKDVLLADAVGDIVTAIEGDTPRLISSYTNDIRRAGWNGGASADKLKATLEAMDTEIGKILETLEKKGIADKTTILLCSLSDSTYGNTKVDFSNANSVMSLAKLLEENCGVKAQIATAAGALKTDVKVLLIKQYHMTPLQMYFVNGATQEEKDRVLNFLKNEYQLDGARVVEQVLSADELGLSEKYCDYLICPAKGYSFSAASASDFRVGDLHDSNMFCVLSGADAPVRSEVDGNASILDFVPTISQILGVEAPDQCEGKAWRYQEVEAKPYLTVAEPAEGVNVYQDTVEVTGVVDYPCKVQVNGKAVTLNDQNTFAAQVELTEGDNAITVTAENKFGVTTEVRHVNYIVLNPMPDGNRVVYINWDGFAKYYLEEAIKTGRNIPVLKSIVEEQGVSFENCFTLVPSITNAMQPAIVSGTTPIQTGNHYRYFNKEKNTVLQFSRENAAETIAEAALRQDLSTISINQFALEDRGTTAGDSHCAYVSAPGGADGEADAMDRFDCAIQMVQQLKAGDVKLSEVPRFIALYMDDIDGLGHNEHDTYGIAKADSEAQRMENVLSQLEKMDAKLGEFIQACKDAGIYDTMSFILTADHGMARYGRQEETYQPGDEKYYSSLPDLMQTIDGLGEEFQSEFLTNPDVGQGVPSAGTTVAVVTVGLQVQLSYIGVTDPQKIAEMNHKVMEALKDKEYIERFMEPEEIVARGCKSGFADLLISPKEPYSFKSGTVKERIAMGQHDSLADDAQRIVGLMWGKNIKKGVKVTETIHNSDFASMMALLLGVNAPLDSTGTICYSALEGIEQPTEYRHEMQSAAEEQGAYTYQLPVAADYLLADYACEDDVYMSLSVNGNKIRDILFPETNSDSAFLTKRINITLKQGDEIQLVPVEGSGKISLGTIALYGTEKAAPPEISISGVPEVVSYGDRFALTVAGMEEKTVEWSVVSGPAVVKEDGVVSITGVGTVKIQARAEMGEGFDAAIATAEFAAQKAVLTVTADDKTKKAGEKNPTFTCRYQGFVNGEDERVLAEKPVLSCEATADSPEGEYAIVLSGGKDDHYAFALQNGVLTVEKAGASGEENPDDTKPSETGEESWALLLGLAMISLAAIVMEFSRRKQRR